MAPFIYILCALTAFLCAWLLFKTYSRSRYRLLLWGGLCFGGLTVNNFLLVVDKLFLVDIDLTMWRLSAGLLSIIVLLYGLIWDTGEK